MKSPQSSVRLRRRAAKAARRARLLAKFDSSGLSAAAFVRKHGLNYTTFAAWRHRSVQKKNPIAFAQVELASSEPTYLTVEVGTLARVRLTSADQIQLAARLLRCLQSPC